MNIDKIQRDVSKALAKEPLNQLLPPGSPRRYEPEAGVRKHNERIHRESKYADSHKNLPFTFRKPLKPMGRSQAVVCDNCGHAIYANTATVGMVCPGCKKFSTVTPMENGG